MLVNSRGWFFQYIYIGCRRKGIEGTQIITIQINLKKCNTIASSASYSDMHVDKDRIFKEKEQQALKCMQ
jgi:hypothetical protein